MGRWRKGVLVAAGLFLARPAAAAAPAAPWRACDYLDPAAWVPAEGGLRLEAGAITREALAGPAEVRVRGSVEATRGWGIGLRVRRLPLGRGAAREGEAHVSYREPAFRAAAGAGTAAWRSRRESWAVGQVHVLLSRTVLAGGRIRVFPSQSDWAPEITASVVLAQGCWWARVGLGPEPETLELALGIRVRPDLVWSTTWSGSGPGLGMAWGWGPVELRARRVSHPDLGAVQQAWLVLGRRGA